MVVQGLVGMNESATRTGTYVESLGTRAAAGITGMLPARALCQLGQKPRQSPQISPDEPSPRTLSALSATYSTLT